MDRVYGESTFDSRRKQVIGIPITSAEYEYAFSCSKAMFPDPATQYQIMPSPKTSYSKIRYGGANALVSKMIKLGETMDHIAEGIREHVKLGSKFSETLKGKLTLGARILKDGGVEKVFKQRFNATSDEKLWKASQCYLSTTAGPIPGLLFLSNHRVAFCSERSIKIISPMGNLIQKVHYKVMIPLRKIKGVLESENVKKPSQKYLKIVTDDNFEFWFMGFLNHHKALRYLQQSLHQPR